MHIVAIFGLLLLSAAAGTLLSLYLLARRTIDQLRAQLTAAREAQQTQTSLLLQRSELDGIKDEFISTVSHELRTPLTSIRGALGLLSAGLLGAVEPKAQNLLRIAVTNTDRLIRLINDILDLERMESGRAPLHIRRCSLRELVLQSLETMQAMGDTAGVKLEPVLMSSPDTIFFDGDPDRILQVLTNLLSNAIKFSPKESLVRVIFEGNGQTVRLRVSDQGRGIPTNKLDTIFDRFQQVEASDARQKGGTGLGLAICRTIINQHGGRIWALANEGGGASLCWSCRATAARWKARPSLTPHSPASKRMRPSSSATTTLASAPSSPSTCSCRATASSRPNAASRPSNSPTSTPSRPSSSTSICPASVVGDPAAGSRTRPRP